MPAAPSGPATPGLRAPEGWIGASLAVSKQVGDTGDDYDPERDCWWATDERGRHFRFEVEAVAELAA